jgi:hypothetical protein
MAIITIDRLEDLTAGGLSITPEIRYLECAPADLQESLPVVAADVGAVANAVP